MEKTHTDPEVSGDLSYVAEWVFSMINLSVTLAEPGHTQTE